MIRLLAETLKTMNVVEGEQVCSVLSANLNGRSGYIFRCGYPISVIHERERIKDAAVAHALQDHFDEEGFTPLVWEREALESYVQSSQGYLQSIDMAILSDDAQRLEFQNKRPKDYWKRLKSVEGIEAIVDIDVTVPEETTTSYIKKQLMESSNGQWPLESDLRDAMRSKKENGGLRHKPFIWVVVIDGGTSEHVVAMARHYFGSNVLSGTLGSSTSSYVMGYMPTLDAISLRKFYQKG